jgi:hypothetical protein
MMDDDGHRARGVGGTSDVTCSGRYVLYLNLGVQSSVYQFPAALELYLSCSDTYISRLLYIMYGYLAHSRIRKNTAKTFQADSQAKV